MSDFTEATTEEGGGWRARSTRTTEMRSKNVGILASGVLQKGSGTREVRGDDVGNGSSSCNWGQWRYIFEDKNVTVGDPGITVTAIQWNGRMILL